MRGARSQMFDFRYHALSLVAVFLALGIGIVLGSTAGDSVVSQASRDLRSSLRGDLVSARQDARAAHAAVIQRDRFIDSVFASAAAGRLAGERVALISSGSMPAGLEASVKQAITGAGGTIDSTSTFDAAPNLDQIASKLGGGFKALANNPAALKPLAAVIGRALVRGGPLAERIQTALSASVSGSFAGAGAVVFYQSADPRDAPSTSFEAGLVNGVRSMHLPVVGVEQLSAQPSQVPWYSSNGMASVDDLDLGAGRIALVLALSGSQGAYGFKDTASAPLPPTASH